jgi:hypothetical protein
MDPYMLNTLNDMKIRILRGDKGKWYHNTDNISKEFRVIDYYDSSILRFLIEGGSWVDKNDCVITDLPKSFCVKRCNDTAKWKKYIDWLNRIYDKHLIGDVWRYYGANSKGECDQNKPFGTELHIDDIIKHIDFYSEPMVVESEEEFDMTTNEGRLAYAIKYYPIGTKYRGYDFNGNVAGDICKVLRTPRDHQYDNIDAGPDWIYIHKFNKWAEIINEVKEETKMETNILELIRLFPELPTDYAKELVVEALKVKNGNLIDLSKFINTVKNTLTTNYDIIPGNRPDNKADYVWRKINDFKNKEEIMETQKLSRKGLKEIHSVACSTWKVNLENYSKRNTLEDFIELTNIEVGHMFNSCTKEQLPIVSKYLKQDDGSVDISKVVYGQDGVLLNNKYIVRHNAITSITNGFWLNPDYNWEVKMISDTPFLVPTKKKQSVTSSGASMSYGVVSTATDTISTTTGKYSVGF